MRCKGCGAVFCPDNGRDLDPNQPFRQAYCDPGCRLRAEHERYLNRVAAGNYEDAWELHCKGKMRIADEQAAEVFAAERRVMRAADPEFAESHPPPDFYTCPWCAYLHPGPQVVPQPWGRGRPVFTDRPSPAARPPQRRVPSRRRP